MHGFKKLDERIWVLISFVLMACLMVAQAYFENKNDEHSYLSLTKLNNQGTVLQLEIKDMNVAFSHQVTAMKNLLLRGKDADLYHSQLSQYYTRERETLNHLDKVLSQLPDEDQLNLIMKKITDEHRLLSKRYRKAIRVFNTSEERAHVFADRVLQDSDKEFLSLITSMNDAALRVQQKKISQLRVNTEERHFFSWLLIVAISAPFIIFLYVLLDRRVKTLRDSEARYQRAERGTNDGLWEWNIATGEDYFSPRWLAILGYEPGDLPYHVDTFIDLIHPDDKAAVQLIMENHLQNGALFDIEMRLRNKYGKYVWIHSRGQVEKNEQNHAGTMSGFITDITERKQAESQLRRINDQLQISIENMPNAYILWDQNLHVIEWNKAAEEIFGYSKQEMLGKNPVNYIVPEPVRHLVRNAMRELEIGKVADYSEKNNNIRKDGESISCQWFNTPLTDTNGNVSYILTLAQDITARVKTEEALHEASELNERIISESPIGLAIYDHAGQCIAANSAVAKIVGATREQVLAQNYNEIESWKKSGLFDTANESIKHQHNTRHGFDIVTTFGKRAFFDCLFVPFKVHSEQRLLLMLDDTTERKQAEEALKDSEERLRMAMSAAEMGAWKWNIVTNQDTRDANFNRILGLEATESTQPVDDFVERVHPEDRAVVDQELKRSIRERDTYLAEFRIIRPDGTEKWLHDQGLPYYDEHNTISYMTGAVVDITERKQAEVELTKHRNHLEELITERTKELQDAQSELVRKERLATLGQLTATVSHELRNPLGAMRPSLYIVDKNSDKNDERVQHAIGLIDRNIDRCDHIIDELLSFTRITTLDKKLTFIDKWLESVVNEQNIMEDIRIEKNFSLNDLELEVDTDRLRRAIINVIENACHAMLDINQSEAIENSCLCISTRRNNQRIEIIISDNGTGIAEDILVKIFEPLFSTKGFGVGLGMPTVKQIMEQHAGGIEIDSEENKGTTVTLWLPENIATENNKGA